MKSHEDTEAQGQLRCRFALGPSQVCGSSSLDTCGMMPIEGSIIQCLDFLKPKQRDNVLERTF